MKKQHGDDQSLPEPLAAAGIPTWLVRALVPRARRDEFVGDLVELWHAERRASGARGAGRLVWRELLRSAPSLLALRWQLGRPPAPRTAGTPARPQRAFEDAEAVRAFAGFLGGAQPRRRRHGPVAFAVGCHGAVLGAALLWSAWQTEELAPPPVILTLSSLASGPPAGYSPAAGPTDGKQKAASRARPRKKQTREATRPSTAAPSAPLADGPSEGDAPTGAASAVAHPGSGPGGDDQGGTGGSCAGVSCAGAAGSVLGPSVAAMQCLDCPPPALPPAFAQVAGRQDLSAKVCVSATGTVTSVKVLRGIDASVDAGVIDKVRAWRYRPYFVSGRPVPFCYMLRFSFEVH